MRKRIPWNKGLTKKDHPSIARSGFQIGHKPYKYWLGKKIPQSTIDAMQRGFKKYTPYNKGVFYSNSYSCIHKWLVRQFGKATKCESKFCTKPSHVFDYALIKKKKYDHVRENFVQLCRRCHLDYDKRNKKIK